MTDHEVEVSRRALDLANVKRWIPEDHRLNSLAIARQSLKTGILESFVRDRRPHPLEFSARESFLHELTIKVLSVLHVSVDQLLRRRADHSARCT